MKKKILIAGLVLLLLVGVGVGVYAAGSQGSQSDPLITKSYLDKVVLPELEQTLQNALAELPEDPNAGVFRIVILQEGQSIQCPVGTEVLLYFGSATAQIKLSDVTAGATVYDGEALERNHLYLSRDPGAGVLAAGEVYLLVSGEYTLG